MFNVLVYPKSCNCQLRPNNNWFDFLFLFIIRVYNYGSKDFKSKRTSKLHEQLNILNNDNGVFIRNQLIVAAGQLV